MYVDDGKTEKKKIESPGAPRSGRTIEWLLLISHKRQSASLVTSPSPTAPAPGTLTNRPRRLSV